MQRFYRANSEYIESLINASENKNTKDSTRNWLKQFEKWAVERKKEVNLEKYAVEELTARDTTPNGRKSPDRLTISRSGDQTCKMLKNVSHPGEKFENLFGRQKPRAVEHFECHIRILRVKKLGVTVGQHMVTVQNFEISLLAP